MILSNAAEEILECVEHLSTLKFEIDNFYGVLSTNMGNVDELTSRIAQAARRYTLRHNRHAHFGSPETEALPLGAHKSDGKSESDGESESDTSRSGASTVRVLDGEDGESTGVAQSVGQHGFTSYGERVSEEELGDKGNDLQARSMSSIAANFGEHDDISDVKSAHQNKKNPCGYSSNSA